MIARAVRTKFQPGFFNLLAKPGTRGKMRLAQRGTMHAAIAGRADLRERVKIGAEALGVDTEHFPVVTHRNKYSGTQIDADERGKNVIIRVRLRLSASN